MPQGLYIIKKGYVKIGVEKLIPYKVPGMSESWCRPKTQDMRHATNFVDPIPESKQNIQTYKIKEKFTLNIKNDD